MIASPRGYRVTSLGHSPRGRGHHCEIVLEDLDLGGAWLRECRLVDTDLRRIDLGGSDLTRSDLSRSVLRSCRFDGALLDMVTLSGAVFRGCSGRPKSARGCAHTGPSPSVAMSCLRPRVASRSRRGARHPGLD
ncbi:MAG: pentapeptide repeat-containing protein [Actinomycetales bacterium]|nr:pentapeptide repeat-containing protein [Candidatus Phosphoribacter baldrii]